MEIGYFLVKTSLRWFSGREQQRQEKACLSIATQCLIILLAQGPCMCEIILGRCGCHGNKSGISYFQW